MFNDAYKSSEFIELLNKMKKMKSTDENIPVMNYLLDKVSNIVEEVPSIALKEIIPKISTDPKMLAINKRKLEKIYCLKKNAIKFVERINNPKTIRTIDIDITTPCDIYKVFFNYHKALIHMAVGINAPTNNKYKMINPPNQPTAIRVVKLESLNK